MIQAHGYPNHNVQDFASFAIGFAISSSLSQILQSEILTAYFRLECDMLQRQNYLSLRGVLLGTISKVSHVLATRDERPTPPDPISERFDRIRVRSLTTTAGLLAHDSCVESQSVLDAERGNKRARYHQREHFADFAAWLLPHVTKSHGHDFYIPPVRSWRYHCYKAIVSSDEPLMDEPPLCYTCDTCGMGDHQICTSCFNNGKRCLD